MPVSTAVGKTPSAVFFILALQIEPREVEIGEMKETIRAMDSELERYHKSNAGLDLTIQVSIPPASQAKYFIANPLVLSIEDSKPRVMAAQHGQGKACP